MGAKPGIHVGNFGMASRWEKWLGLSLVIFLLGAAAYLRLNIARLAQFPGHSDYAFYYTVASNIADGRWLQIDYIWHYLNGLPPITHYSSDFWMPLTSILDGLGMLVLGKTLFAALVPAILAGLAISLPTYFIGRTYSQERLVALTSAALILFLPVLFRYSLLTDSSVYYTLFVSSALLLMVKGLKNPRWFLPAAALAGLAHLTRQDGLLAFAVLIITIFIAPLTLKTRLAYILLSTGIYALVLSPLLLKNLQELGVAFPRGSSQTMFLTTYEDFYVYGKELSLKQYLAQGIPAILKFKLATALYDLNVTFLSLTPVLSLLTIAAVIDHVFTPSLRARWRSYLPPILLFAFIFAFYTFIATYSSYGTGYRRSLMALMPFFVVIAVDFVYRRLPWKPIVIAAAIVLLVYFAFQANQSSRAMLAENNKIGEELSPLRSMLLADAARQGIDPQEIVLMARDTWEVYEATHLPAIQVPNNDLDTIHQVAQHYHANYILLPAKREALEPIYTGEETDDRFALVGQVPNTDLKLFRSPL